MYYHSSNFLELLKILQHRCMVPRRTIMFHVDRSRRLKVAVCRIMLGGWWGIVLTFTPYRLPWDLPGACRQKDSVVTLQYALKRHVDLHGLPEQLRETRRSSLQVLSYYKRKIRLALSRVAATLESDWLRSASRASGHDDRTSMDVKDLSLVKSSVKNQWGLSLQDQTQVDRLPSIKYHLRY